MGWQAAEFPDQRTSNDKPDITGADHWGREAVGTSVEFY
jgi:hypothetical protein